MKINRLKLSNFRCHENLDVRLDKVTVIVGRNGSGKSSIKAAIEYALTGRCEWTDGRGAGADELVRHGAPLAWIEMDLDGIGCLKRSVPNSLQVAEWKGSTTVQQSALHDQLGTSESAISAALNTTGFLGLDPRSQRQVLFSLLGLSFEAEKLTKMITDAAATEGVAEWLRGQLDASGTYEPEVFDQLEKAAVAERRALKRQLQELEPLVDLARSKAEAIAVPDGLKLEDKDTIARQITELRAERDKLMVQQGKTLATASERQQLIARRDQTRLQIEAGRQTLQVMPAPSKEELEKLQKQEAELQAQQDAAKESLAALQRQGMPLAGRASALQDAIDALSEAERGCPLAPELVECPMTDENRQALIQQLTSDMEAARAELSSIEAEEKRILHEYKEAQAALADISAKCDGIQRAIVARERAEADQFSAEAELERLEQKLQETPIKTEQPELQQRIAELGERIGRGEEILQALAARETAMAASEAQKEHYTRVRKQLEMIEAICTAVGSGASSVRTKAISQAVGGLQKRADERCALLTGGEYSISFTKDLDIRVTREGYGTRSVSTLSASEQFRVGIVMQDILAGLSGLGVMIIDGADILDVDNRALMTEMLMSISEDYSNILVLSTLGDITPVDPGVDGLSVYVLGDGEIKQAQRAA